MQNVRKRETALVAGGIVLGIAIAGPAAQASMWPWHASDLENLVHSRPNSEYYIEAWDYYLNGIFQYTRYCVVSL